MHARQITQRCQDVIDTETVEKPKLNGINKITNGIRLQCKSPEDATILRTTVNWNSAFDGLEVHKPKYGVVVHGVSIKALEALNNEDTKSGALKEWGDTNGGIKLEGTKPLRRKSRPNAIPRPLNLLYYSRTIHTPRTDVLNSGFSSIWGAIK